MPGTDNSKTVRILSIDGGGIRGILPGQILVRLESILGGPIYEHFDLVAGTSTGGILACVLLCPDDPDKAQPRARFTAEEAVAIYLERGDEIFERSWLQTLTSAGGVTDEKYDEGELEDTLNDFLDEIWLSDLLKPCLITAYDVRRRKAHFFNQNDAARLPSSNFLVRDVARATSAAPTYFEAARIKSKSSVPYPLIDGGVFANNPTMCAYAEARTMTFPDRVNKPTAKDMVILSLGTGTKRKPYRYKEVKDWGLAEWVRPLIDILMTGNSDSVDYHLRQIFDAIGKPPQYLRIEPLLGDASTEMDDASPENLLALREAGIETAEQFQDELKRFAEFLV